MGIKVKSNYHPRDRLDYMDLTHGELEEFDYLDKEQLELTSFIRYGGRVYNLCDICPIDSNYWDGVYHYTHFWGMVVKFNEDGTVICGEYYCTDTTTVNELNRIVR